MTEPDPLEDILLPELAELIEGALDFVAAPDAMDHLQEISDRLQRAVALIESSMQLRANR